VNLPPLRMLLSPRGLWQLLQVWKMGRRMKAMEPELYAMLKGLMVEPLEPEDE